MSAVIQHSKTQGREPSPLPAGDGAAAFAFDGDGSVSRDAFAAHVRALAARLPCPECGHVGLLIKRRSDLDGDWPCARPCAT